MRWLILLSLTVYGFASQGQTPKPGFRTYCHDSTQHYFLGVDTNAGPEQIIPNPMAYADLQELKMHPMVMDPLEITVQKFGVTDGYFTVPEYDFLKPGKYKNDLNFNLKLRQ